MVKFVKNKLLGNVFFRCQRFFSILAKGFFKKKDLIFTEKNGQNWNPKVVAYHMNEPTHARTHG